MRSFWSWWRAPAKEIPVAAITPLCTQDARTPYDRAPRDLTHRGKWRAPDDQKPLQRIAVRGGWYFVLAARGWTRFWVAEIKGPEHGLAFYGPFDGDPRSLPEKAETL